MSDYVTVSATLALRISEAKIAFSKIERLANSSFSTAYSMEVARTAAQELRDLLDAVLAEMPAPPVEEAVVLPLKRRSK